MRALLFFLLITLCLATTAGFSQGVPARVDEKQVGGSRYFIGKEHELLMPLNILGPVNKPGQYMVPSETDLISLVAYAGGFGEEAKPNEVKIIRKMGDHAKPNIIKVNLEQYYATGDQELTPPLLPDDTVIVGRRNLLTISKVTNIIQSIAFAAQTIYVVYLVAK